MIKMNQSLHSAIVSKYSEIDGIVVVRHGCIVCEAGGAGFFLSGFIADHQSARKDRSRNNG